MIRNPIVKRVHLPKKVTFTLVKINRVTMRLDLGFISCLELVLLQHLSL